MRHYQLTLKQLRDILGPHRVRRIRRNYKLHRAGKTRAAQILELLDAGESMVAIAARLKVSRQTLYRQLHREWYRNSNGSWRQI